MDKTAIIEKILISIDADSEKLTCNIAKKELAQEKELFQDLDLNNPKDFVELGSLIRLTCNDMAANYFISPSGNGNLIKIKGGIVVVLSVFSPLGASVLSLKKGESVEIKVRDNIKKYKVEEIF